MKRILIVDDEAALVRNLAEFLRRINDEYEVATATRGDEAFDMIERGTYDILLTDVRMPGLDGLELVSRALAIEPSIQPVIMTAHGSPAMQRDAIDRGVLRFLNKPIDLDSLELLLDELDTTPERSEAIGGLSVLDVIDFFSATGENKVLEFTTPHGSGKLVLLGGNLIHCIAGDMEGNDAFLALAAWGEGTVQELHRESPEVYERNVTMTVDELVVAARRSNEDPSEPLHPPTDATETMNQVQSQVWNEKPFGEKESEMTESGKSRSQRLKERLDRLVVNSSEIGGALAVGNDGLILAANLPEGYGKAERVGAQTAALLGLSQRTLQQLGCGDSDVLISQGTEAWLVAVAAGKVGVVALAQAGSNLGMVMLELREAAQDVKEIIG